MRRLRIFLTGLGLAGLALATSVAAADYAREARWADEVQAGLVTGEARFLQTENGHKFLALYTPAASATTAVVLVHGAGVHPDWGLVGALRQSLPDAGYATLSLQMPVEAADAKPEAYPANFPEAAERIARGVAFMKAQGYRRIVLVSHSMGSRMAEHYLAKTRGTAIAAWVSVGITEPYAKLDGVNLPVLDLYGEEDFPRVLAAAPARAKVIAGKSGSAQARVHGADHYFNGKEKALEKVVEDFIKGLP